MAEFVALRLKVATIRVGDERADRNAIGDDEPMTGDPHDLLRIVGQESDGREPQIGENLRRQGPDEKMIEADDFETG